MSIWSWYKTVTSDNFYNQSYKTNIQHKNGDLTCGYVGKHCVWRINFFPYGQFFFYHNVFKSNLLQYTKIHLQKGLSCKYRLRRNKEDTMHVHFVVLVCLCLVYKTVAVSRPSTMRFQNNQFTNVVVAFHDSIQEDKNLIDQLKVSKWVML